MLYFNAYVIYENRNLTPLFVPFIPSMLNIFSVWYFTRDIIKLFITNVYEPNIYVGEIKFYWSKMLNFGNLNIII